MTTTIQINIVQRINELYAEAHGHANMAQGFANSAIQAAWECGKLLNEQKKALGHGNWLEWLTENCPDITERTSQKYMRLANTNRDSYLTDARLTDSYRKAGILPDIENNGSGKLITSEDIKALQSALSIYQFLKKNEETLRDDQKQQWKERLKPLVEFWERL